MTSPPRLKRSQQTHTETGIIHLGPGAFFRAFNAVYTSETVQKTNENWGICGVSLHSQDIRNKLRIQDYAYTSVSLKPQGFEYKVIEIINDILVAPENPQAVLNAMADPAIHIVSMTITEKGYYHNPATGELRLDDSDIQYDLQHPTNPRTAVGFLVHALALRKAAKIPPFTILSCDNLPNNGELVREVVMAFAKAVNDELAVWIDQHCRFPSTMVDRITPATTENDIKQLADSQGYLDEACVVHEPFRQWIIEDSFVNNKRPDWNIAGVQFVNDVKAFELMKLRCLNGTHSTLAYLGYLAGFETIAETTAEPAFVALLKSLWKEEIIPTVPQPKGEDLPQYCDELLKRYQNPKIRHLTWQIAMDGSQKLPQRLLNTIQDNLNAGRDISRLTLAVAAWMRYVGGIDENRKVIDVRDPFAKELKVASDSGNTPEEKVSKLLTFEAIFPNSLAVNQIFRNQLIQSYSNLNQFGALKVVQELAN